MERIIRPVGCFFVLATGMLAGAAHGGEQPLSTIDAAAAATPMQEMWERPSTVEPFFSSSSGTARGAFSASFLSLNQDPEGDLPRDVAFTPDGAQVLAVQRDTDNVTFFDASTRSPLGTVAVGDFPVDVVVTPDGQYAVVPNVFSNDVTIIDVATRTVAGTVPVTGEQPFRVAITADSSKAVVGVITDGSTSRFSIIDLTTFTESLSFPCADQGVVGFFATPETGTVGNIFSQFVITPDGSKIILPDIGNDQVIFYNGLTGAQLAALPTVNAPNAIDISDDGSVAVVAHGGNPGAVTEIDVVAQTVTGSFSISEFVSGDAIRITPDKAFAMAAISNNLIFVDLTTGAITSTVSTGLVGDIEVSFDGQYAFVANFNARVIDIASQSLVRTITFASCYDSAVSPTDYRVVALNNRFREDLHFYNINGASGFFEGFVPAGEPAEGDATFGVDISADGFTIVACHISSRNVAIIELDNALATTYVDVGDRAREVRITPDGAYAVVCAQDENEVVIIDLDAKAVVKRLFISTRPSRVRISPDSQFAYVLNVAGSDRISFIELDGANSSIVAQVSAGQTGSANGYAYGEASGIELSPDGSLLTVCDSFNDLVRIYDTASFTQIDAVFVGDFPIRATFNATGDRIYVTNSFDDSVVQLEESGGSWSLINGYSPIDFPLTVDVDAADEYVYVGNAGNDPAIRVFDTTNFNLVATIPFVDGSPRDSFLSTTDNILYAAMTNGELVRINAAGPTSALIDALPLAAGPSDLAFNDTAKIAVAAQPVPDGVDIIDFGDQCPEDLSGDDSVDSTDLFQLLGAWGSCSGCPEDLTGDGVVDTGDLFALLGAWGSC